jgi:glycerol transport system permease protein
MKSRAWLFLTPALILVSLSAFIPIMTVINYSLHLLYPGSIPEYYRLGNYVDIFQDEIFMTSIKQQFLFTLQVLAIEIPIGVMVALAMPTQGKRLTLILVLLGIPLLIPFPIVGMVWRVFTRADLGVVPKVLAQIGYDYRPVQNPIDAWVTTLLMDMWHWIPLVAMLAFAGLQTIPEPYYQAARIDGASKWATFRYVTLPRLRYVLILSVLLRAMDSFNIYSEVFMLTGGGPGNTTNFMSLYTSSQAVGGTDLGLGSALSMVYLFLVVMLCYVLYTIMMKAGQGGGKK